MKNWIGEMGGLTAIALIAALGVRFLREMGAWKDERLVREYARKALFCVLIGVGYLTLGGLYYRFFRAEVSAWDIGAVWGLDSFSLYLCFVPAIVGALLLDSAIAGGVRVVLLPFAFLLYTRPAVALGFCAVCALVRLLACRHALPPVPRMAPWLTAALCVLGGFALFVCL